MIYTRLTGFLIWMSHVFFHWCLLNINIPAVALKSHIVLGNLCPSLQQLHLFAAHRLFTILSVFLLVQEKFGCFVELLSSILHLRKD